MPVILTWHDILIRLIWTLVGGAAIGFDRGERGRSAGLRTTMLVCLAASLAMLQANLLMNTTGKARDSFVVLDLMRLPLGILSGIGFIGAGAIIKHGPTVHGVTTAATMWFVTVMGLCFGGGQIGLGAAALGLGLVTLWAVKLIEWQMTQDQHGSVIVTTTADGPDDNDIRAAIELARYRVTRVQIAFDNESHRRRVTCEVRWRAKRKQCDPPDMLKGLARRAGVLKLRWKL